MVRFPLEYPIEYPGEFGNPGGGAVPPAALSFTIVGVAAGTNTVAIPAHLEGDLILIGASRPGNGAPTIPAAAGQVPTYTQILAGGANTLSLITGFFVVTTLQLGNGQCTSGTWVNADRMEVIVLRANYAITIGASSSGNDVLTETIVYPALVRQTSTGMGVRFARRGTADTEVADAPAGWVNRQATPATPSMALHTLALMAADPTADTVPTVGTPAPYRAHTIEIRQV